MPIFGADVLVAPFPDATGRDAVIQWPGGINMQLYWHTTKPSYTAFETIPENRVYISPVRANDFLRSFLAFSHGRVVSDDPHAPRIEIGRPGDTLRRVRVESLFGKLAVAVTDGHLPYPLFNERTDCCYLRIPGRICCRDPRIKSVNVQPNAKCRSGLAGRGDSVRTWREYRATDPDLH